MLLIHNNEAKARLKELPPSWKDPKSLAALLSSLKGIFELAGRMTGEITTSPSVQVILQQPQVKEFIESVVTHIVTIYGKDDRLEQLVSAIEKDRLDAAACAPKKALTMAR